MSITDQLSIVEKRILSACKNANRKKEDVRLLLASKKVSPERLIELLATPYRLLGENTVQELKKKQEQLQGKPFEWHFIGHLQSNKVKDVVGVCDLIHSVDRFSLAQEISKRSLQKKITQKILIEINTSGEKSKSGVSPEQAVSLCRQISNLTAVRICGLMTIAENSNDETAVRSQFRQLKNLSLSIDKENLPQTEMKELSMGMSQDFEWAIQEGATLLRIGSLIFGERP